MELPDGAALKLLLTLLLRLLLLLLAISVHLQQIQIDLFDQLELDFVEVTEARLMEPQNDN